LTLYLPWLPSVNHYYCTARNGRRYIGEPGLRFRRAAWLAWKQLKTKPLTGPIWVEVDLYPPDKRRRDIDNGLKCLLDALQHAGAYPDDSQVCRVKVTRRETAKGGKTVVDLGEWYGE